MPASRLLLRRRSLPLAVALMASAVGAALSLAPPSQARATTVQAAAPADAAVRRAVGKNADLAVQRELRRQAQERPAHDRRAATGEGRPGVAIR